jgi:hypothetical protein
MGSLPERGFGASSGKLMHYEYGNHFWVDYVINHTT